MSDEACCYPPDFRVLRNRFGIRDASDLDIVEREFVTERSRQSIPLSTFDLKHLKAIHRHLFQDVYDWAGELRTVEISKGGSQFQFRRFIEAGMADVHRRLVDGRFLRRLDAEGFAAGAAAILGDVNYVHPFREGNGRTQMVYLAQLARQAGHGLDLAGFEAQAWMAASRQAHLADYAPMARCIAGAIRTA
ncbi:cell division protein [Aureimonas sp. Leaf454]|uniref:Fic/DOC family protein n=1 Tax=Aureimonas sp. Leaf454 TaxID=1736381 RepID=UPI000700EC4B|nr:Fic family protein [Aureimonas sp. Leaf454]KQT42990.1 cell division protein [Aureimonas sp. Leaf454]